MLDALPAVAKWVNDWLLALAGTAATIATFAGGVVWSNLRRSTKNERRLEGDDDDPNYEGVLEVAHETRAELEEFRRETRRDHREVMARIEELDDDAVTDGGEAVDRGEE